MTKTLASRLISRCRFSSGLTRLSTRCAWIYQHGTSQTGGSLFIRDHIQDKIMRRGGCYDQRTSQPLGDGFLSHGRYTHPSGPRAVPQRHGRLSVSCDWLNGRRALLSQRTSGRDPWGHLKNDWAVVRCTVYLAANLAHLDTVHHPLAENDYAFRNMINYQQRLLPLRKATTYTCRVATQCLSHGN